MTLADIRDLAAQRHAQGDAEAADALQRCHDALLWAAVDRGFTGADQPAHRAGQYLSWAEAGPPGQTELDL